jgi:Zn-dependent protease with chaperone function
MLTVSQFRAVLAHEFAHYYAGDTGLAPWVYGTTRALARVYENLGKKSDIMSFLARWQW